MAESAGRPRRLTPKQFGILKFIRDYVSENGSAPTRAEIAGRFGFSSANAAEQHLRALARKGLIRLVPGKARGILLLEPALRFRASDAALPVDLFGTASGEAEATAWVKISPDVFTPRADGLYSAPDESMERSGIRPGDWVAIRRTTQWPPEGRIALVRFGGKAMLRRVRKDGGRMLFAADAPGFGELECPESARRHLIGEAVGLIRRNLG
ncbi:MAG: hypothetical protein MR428_04580 [Mesosutterella sp.]|nr:hypothetical protein [Mesosutterella sp.]